MASILLIDDDTTLREVLALALDRDGHRVITAGDGDEGLAAFRADPVDLVITDIVMPGREGIETILALHAEAPDTPIIAMSGGGARSPVYLSLARRLGAHTILAKPFSIAEFREAVAHALDRGASPGPPPSQPENPNRP